MRLSNATLADYTGPAARPSYDRASVTPGIVHLGIGSFHRAHQAAYVDRALAEDASWGIRAFSLRRPDTRDALAPQDGLYTLAERGAEGISARIIGSVLSVEVGGEAARSAIADPTTRLVTLTVTEKGYTPDLAGLIVAALAWRDASGAGPLTILSCDNLSRNGEAMEALIRAAVDDPSVERYIDRSVRFPSSMVDRITPATTDANRVEIAALTGLDDVWPVVTEPFSQWVIEDSFAGDRPPLEGVEWVADVAPYEEAKLRLLNGAHTTLAMLGPMLGHHYVSDAVGDPVLRNLINQAVRQEVIPHLALGAEFLQDYWQALLTRFENPALNHALAQIASDTSQKVPQRLVAPLVQAQAAGRGAPGLILAVAAWLEHIRRETRAGRALQDPMADQLLKLAAGTPIAALDALRVPGAPLCGLTPELADAVLAAHDILDNHDGAALAERLRSYGEQSHA